MKSKDLILVILVPVLIYAAASNCESRPKASGAGSKELMIARMKQRMETKKAWESLDVIYLEDVLKGIGPFDVVAKQRAFLQHQLILVCDGQITSRELDTSTGEFVFEIENTGSSAMLDVVIRIRSNIELARRGQEGMPYSTVNGCFVMSNEQSEGGFRSYLTGGKLVVGARLAEDQLFKKGSAPAQDQFN